MPSSFVSAFGALSIMDLPSGDGGREEVLRKLHIILKRKDFSCVFTVLIQWLSQTSGKYRGGGRSLGTGVKCSTRKPRGEEIAVLRRESVCSMAKWHRQLLLQAGVGLTSLQQGCELPPGCLEVAQDLPPPRSGSAAVSILHPQMDAGSHAAL